MSTPAIGHDLLYLALVFGAVAMYASARYLAWGIHAQGAQQTSGGLFSLWVFRLAMRGSWFVLAGVVAHISIRWLLQ